MNQAELYSQLMDARGHMIGWVAMLLIPALVIILHRGSGRLLNILILAWIVRVCYAVYNTYINSAFVDDFELSAYLESSNGISYIMDGFGPNAQLYTWFCSIIYLVTGRSPLFLEAVNILLGVLIVSGASRLGEMIFGQRIGLWAAGILAIFPASVIFGTLVLRESVWIYPMTLGALFWIRGIRESRPDYVLIAIIPFLIAYAFHAGALGLVLAWACTPMFNGLAVGRGGAKQVVVAMGTLVLVFGVAIVLLNSGLLVSLNPKFDLRSLAADDIFSGLEGAARNRTAYLAELSTTSSGAMSLLWQLPLRFIYFVGMPFPWFVASFSDLVGFVDALFYLLVLYLSIRNWRRLIRNPAATALLIACIFTWGIFSVGTSNYGTAMRHRAKLAPLAMVLVCGLWQISRQGKSAMMPPPANRISRHRMLPRPAVRNACD